MNKILVISDSFKGTLSSRAICDMAVRTVPSVLPGCAVTALPVADGGEGTVDCFLQAAGGEKVSLWVTGPWGTPVEAYYGRVGESAVVEMAAAAGRMVTDAVSAFVSKDLHQAQAVVAYDDRVDALFTQVKSELTAMILENPQNGENCLDLLMIAKYFERIGDHAVNIAEWVMFSITGRHVEAQDNAETDRSDP